MSNGRDRITWLEIPVSEETADRLRALSRACRSDPETVASSLLHDILKEDEEAHFLLSTPTAGSLMN